MHNLYSKTSMLARFMGPTWGPSGTDRTQMGTMLLHELCYLGLNEIEYWGGRREDYSVWTINFIINATTLIAKGMYSNQIHTLWINLMPSGNKPLPEEIRSRYMSPYGITRPQRVYDTKCVTVHVMTDGFLYQQQHIIISYDLTWRRRPISSVQYFARF